MARAAAPIFRGLRVATRTTERRSNSVVLDKKKILPRAQPEDFERPGARQWLNQARERVRAFRLLASSPALLFSLFERGGYAPKAQSQRQPLRQQKARLSGA